MTRNTFPRFARPLAMASILSIAAVGGAATLASAEQHKGDDAAEVQTFLAAKGSLSDAVKAAEDKTGGKAMSAEFENEDYATPIYEVEIAKPDGSVIIAMVDPGTGTVDALSQADHDKKYESDDDGDEGEDDDNG